MPRNPAKPSKHKNPRGSVCLRAEIQMAKNKPNHSSTDAKKNKKKKKMKNSAPNSVAMKLKAPQSNPFETIWSRTKFDILGKKRKGEQKRIGLARSRAIQKARYLTLFLNFFWLFSVL